MSSQAIHEIAIAMRKAVKRSAGVSDSDDPVDMVSNRGNKFRKRAKYVHEGQLAPPNSYRMYEEEITYGDGAYERNIISRIPKLYDAEGYEIDMEDEDDIERQEAAMAEAADEYPYADIRIEELLAPLTAASELAIHPTLSTPFTSKILTQLTQNACEMIHKERASLWKMKHLLTKLGGDHTWIPTSMLEGEDDLLLFGDRPDAYRDNLLLKDPTIIEDDTDSAVNTDGQDIPAIEVAKPVEHSEGAENTTNIEVTPTAETGDVPEGEFTPQSATEKAALTPEIATQDDTAMTDAPEVDSGPASVPELPPAEEQTEEKPVEESTEDIKAEGEVDPDDTLVDDSTILEEDQQGEAGTDANGQREGEDQDLVEGDEEAEEGEDEAPEPRRMRTRAQAQAASDESNPSHTRSGSPNSETYIDPYFVAPLSSLPDRNLSIPSQEADEVRRILQLYIQKQEEVCRGAEKVYNGLLKAERMRKTVFKNAKAEGHIGEMSDGEDWYDLEEWNLTEELKKGQDEEEEDAATTAKKTRTRRQ